MSSSGGQCHSSEIIHGQAVGARINTRRTPARSLSEGQLALPNGASPCASLGGFAAADQGGGRTPKQPKVEVGSGVAIPASRVRYSTGELLAVSTPGSAVAAEGSQSAPGFDPSCRWSRVDSQLLGASCVGTGVKVTAYAHSRRLYPCLNRQQWA